MTATPSILQGWYDGLKPDAVMTVSQWADAKHMLPATAAEGGKYHTSRTPYAREIMDKLSVTDPAQKIVFIKGSQIGATEIGNIWVGYAIDQAPAPMIFIMPTDAVMKKTSKQRIEKMIDTVPELRGKIGKRRGRDTIDNLLYKEFPGGYLSMVGANSPVGLASTPARNMYADEIDRFPQSVGNEGSALSLGETRLSSFGNRAKRFYSSTPTIEGQSQIQAEFDKTGQRYYHVPCPSCNDMQVLDFSQLRYEKGKYDDVQYECCHCKTLHREYAWKRNMEKGQWVAKHPEKEDGYAYGYHLSAMYSPYGFYNWAKMARDFEESRGNLAEEIVFTNTKLGLCHKMQQGEKPDWELIYQRAEHYEANTVFASVAFITAGVDVQADRIEMMIIGWMKGKISQVIDYRVFVGDTSQEDVWQQLGDTLNETWVRQADNALMSIRIMAVDSGHNTEKVYKFTQKHSISRVIPVKGQDKLNSYISAPKITDVNKAGKKIGRVKVWNVGVSLIKSETYGFLKLTVNPETGEVPDGYMHLPNYLETKFFRGLVGEELKMATNKRGFTEYQWHKHYKFNEPLDCRVYARAAAYSLGMDRWSEDRWNREQNSYEIKQEKPAPPAKKKPKKSSFWNS